jgi:hypothetical protein
MKLLYTYPAASKKYKPMVAYTLEELKAELPIELIKEWFHPISESWESIEPKAEPVAKKSKPKEISSEE